MPRKRRSRKFGPRVGRRVPLVAEIADWLAAYDAWIPKTREWGDLISDTIEGIREAAHDDPFFSDYYRRALEHHMKQAAEYPDREEYL